MSDRLLDAGEVAVTLSAPVLAGAGVDALRCDPGGRYTPPSPLSRGRRAGVAGVVLEAGAKRGDATRRDVT